MKRRKPWSRGRRAMETYPKVKLGMLVLAFALPLIAGVFGVHVRPLDETGGGGQI